jgi:alanyl aminopeptidase
MKQKHHEPRWFGYAQSIRPALIGVVAGLALSASGQILAASEPTAAQQANQAQDIPTGQLPRFVTPSHYDLHLTIDPRKEGFSGEVTIDLDFNDSRDLFWIHGQAIEVDSIQLQPAKGRRIDASYEQVESTGVAQIKLDKAYGPGAAQLVIKYHSNYNLALEGLYKVDEAGESYAFTQFEAISARLAFPGFDQPDFKVPFDVRLTVPTGQVAIANTPATKEKDNGNGTSTVTFATSKPIPTYLVAFAVGPFDVVEAKDIPTSDYRDRTIPLRGIAVKGKGDKFEYALENTASIVEALEGYFGIPYPYTKLDLIAVPDFNAGAMENVGAITYREVLLLMDEEATPQQVRAYKSVHSHELAHQWFGNLVTPVWWDDIWLNEAFATWMGHVALDIRDPKDEFRRDLLSRSASAMSTDSLASARQIRQPILSSHDIASAFDGITYSKGGGVLSMFERFLGREAFQKGVSGYLKERSWGNATADDFVAAISAQAPEGQQQQMAQAFQSFLEQPGLPVLETSYNCGAVGDDGIFQVRLTQHRYLPLGSDGNYHQQWKIPACIAYGKGEERHEACRLLEKPLTTWLFRGECPDWVLANAQGAGYYRWNHNGEEWTKVLAVASDLSPGEQIKLADSFVAAFVAGGIGLTDFLDGAHILAQLPTRQAVIRAMPILTDIVEVWTTNEEQRATAQALLRSIYAKPLAAIGLKTVSDFDQASHQESLVYFQAVVMADPVTRAQLLSQASAYMEYNVEGVEPASELNLALMDIALEVAVNEWKLPFVEHLYARLVESQDPVFRSRVTGAFSGAFDPKAAKRVRAMVLDSKLRNNEVFGIIFSQFKEPTTRQAAWKWLQANLEGVLKRIPEWAQGRIAAIGTDFCSVEERAQLNDYFGPRINNMGGGPLTLANTLERIDLCLAQRQHYQADFDRLMSQ